MNVRLGRAFGWASAHVAQLVRSDEQLACLYRKTFGAAPSPGDDEAVLADPAKALAAFRETFDSPPTPFDRFRNALARGERIRPERYPELHERRAPRQRLLEGWQGPRGPRTLPVI